MKTLLVFGLCAAGLFAASPLTAQTTTKENDPGMPVLYKIQGVTLSPSYSCRTRQERWQGYGTTALFLSYVSRDHNGPELLFNGACNAPDEFQGSTAGDDFDVITDYGDVPLESLTLSHAFSPKRRTDSTAEFTNRAKVVKGHTYGMLINKSGVRGFFYFRVAEYVPNRKVELEYVVMDYELLRTEARAPGFSWDKSGVR